MRPYKSGITLANWLLRIGLLGFIVIEYLGAIKPFLINQAFIIAAIYIILAVMLFVGGFLTRPGLTVFSGFLIFGFSIYIMIKSFSGAINSIFVTYFLIASIGFYFMSKGNKG